MAELVRCYGRVVMLAGNGADQGTVPIFDDILIGRYVCVHETFTRRCGR